jgi:hypothetical protein
MIVPPSSAGSNPDGRPNIPSFVSALTWAIPGLECYASGTTFNDLVITSHHSISEYEAERVQLEYSKFLYIERSFEQANTLQQQATSYHTISKTTTQIQADIYKIKYDEACAYVKDYEEAQVKNEDVAQVTVPTIIKNESDVVNQDPYELCISIIQNYLGSNDSLKDYFGQVEGQRRILKRRILAANSVNELLTLSWVDWPEYRPSTPVDLEG